MTATKASNSLFVQLINKAFRGVASSKLQIARKGCVTERASDIHDQCVNYNYRRTEIRSSIFFKKER